MTGSLQRRLDRLAATNGIGNLIIVAIEHMDHSEEELKRFAAERGARPNDELVFVATGVQRNPNDPIGGTNGLR